MLNQFKTYHASFLILIVLLAMACSNARHLSEKESLYMGPKVKIADTVLTAAQKKTFEEELEAAVRPKPNSTFLGIRLKLTLYNIAGVPKKEKGLRNWLRNKIGEAPVLGSDVNIGVNNQILQNIMQNHGFFTAESTGFLDVKKKKSKARFEVLSGPRTYIRDVHYQQTDTSELGRNILSTQDKTLLKTGDPYELQTIINERLRIDYALKNQGYYYFSPDYLLVVADTGIGNNQTDLTVKVKYNEIPENAYKQYRINKVSVFPNYRLSNTTRAGRNQSKDSAAVTFAGGRRQASAADTVKFDDFQVIDRNHTYRPYVFYQAMQFSPGEYYNKKDQNIALNRLVTLGAFKFVKNEFTPVPDTPVNLLNVDYLLTPYAKKSFNGEFGGFTQNDSRGGVRGTISWKNKNMFRGAELLTIKLSGSFEAQYGGISNRPNEYNLSLQNTLNVPRFIIPFVQVKPSGMYIPRTLINLGYEYSLRSGYYQIHSFNVGYGYNWKEEIRKDHKLFPINITLVQTDTIDKENIGKFNLNNLVYNGLIIGPTYEFTFNSQADGIKRRHNFYFNGQLDLAGNIIGLAQKASQDNPQKIFGSNYAQYIKSQVDFRYYLNLNAKSVVAARALFGYGYAYGNSDKLPNVKQFFSGGSSSLRGFPSRLVGPGTYDYRVAIAEGKEPIIEALGDVKTEFSVEFRRKLYSVIEGGIFADAGNIWLLREQPDFPGGTFTKNFYKELAADVGLGLRFDFTILLLRLDFAFPVRKPWYPEGQRWRFNDIRFGDPDWRRENLMFNLAIGYPF